MTNIRNDLMRRLGEVLNGRPVRWARNVIGDYDGRDRTLEVFNADPAEQGDLFRRLRPVRNELEAIAGGPVIVIFHTRTESTRLYSEFVQQALIAEVTGDVEVSEREHELDEEVPALGTDVSLQPRGVEPGTGSKILPRTAA